MVYTSIYQTKPIFYLEMGSGFWITISNQHFLSRVFGAVTDSIKGLFNAVSMTTFPQINLWRERQLNRFMTSVCLHCEKYSEVTRPCWHSNLMITGCKMSHRNHGHDVTHHFFFFWSFLSTFFEHLVLALMFHLLFIHSFVLKMSYTVFDLCSRTDLLEVVEPSNPLIKQKSKCPVLKIML